MQSHLHCTRLVCLARGLYTGLPSSLPPSLTTATHLFRRKLYEVWIEVSLEEDPSAPFQALTDVINDNVIISIDHICGEVLEGLLA